MFFIAPVKPGFKAYKMKLFCCHSTEIYAVSNQKKCLIGTVPLSTHNICSSWGFSGVSLSKTLYPLLSTGSTQKDRKTS